MKFTEGYTLLITVVSSAIGGGGFVKLLDYFNKRKKTNAEVKSLDIKNEIDLVEAAKSLLEPLHEQINWLKGVAEDQRRTIEKFSKEQKELLVQIDELKEMLKSERTQRQHLETELKSHKRTIIQLRQTMADKFGKYKK